MGPLRRLLAVAAFASSASLVAGAALADPLAPFDDVPPCHPAASAVARLADLGIISGFPPDDGYSSLNAVRQVFEGLRCADAGWSLRFLDGAPVQFGLLPRVALVGFELHPTLAQRRADRVEVALALTVVLEHEGVRHVLERTGRVAVERGDHGWRVPYTDLAALDLPVFPLQGALN